MNMDKTIIRYYGSDASGNIHMIFENVSDNYKSKSWFWIFYDRDWLDFFHETEVILSLKKCEEFYNAEENQTIGYSGAAFDSAEEALRSMV